MKTKESGSSPVFVNSAGLKSGNDLFFETQAKTKDSFFNPDLKLTRLNIGQSSGEFARETNHVNTPKLHRYNSQVQHKEEKEEIRVRGFVPQIQRAMPEEGDSVHAPLLDQYSRESGLPRDDVTQHDPDYRAWLIPINITLDMFAPTSTPRPDYSRTENQLGAWEQANFRFTPRISYSCDSVTNGGQESSFVTDVEIQLSNPRFEYFIARHIYNNMNNQGNAQTTWIQIHNRIAAHAREHFVQYRDTVNSLREDFREELLELPSRFDPADINQQQLEDYVEDLLEFMVARLHYELWQVKCNWERTDYPNILRGISNASGRIVPSCGQPPNMPPTPVFPTRVTAQSGSSGTTAGSQGSSMP